MKQKNKSPIVDAYEVSDDRIIIYLFDGTEMKIKKDAENDNGIFSYMCEVLNENNTERINNFIYQIIVSIRNGNDIII